MAGIQAVATGEAVVAPSLTRRLLDAYAHQVLAPNDPAGAQDPRLKDLSEREREVLVAIGNGSPTTPAWSGPDPDGQGRAGQGRAGPGCGARRG